MSLIPAKRYCEMCRETMEPDDARWFFITHKGEDFDYCGAECLTRAALSWVPKEDKAAVLAELSSAPEVESWRSS